MVIAYILHTFTNIEQIARLVRVLKRGSSNAVIVVTHSGPEAERDALRSLEVVDHMFPSSPGRGRFTLIDCYVSALRWLDRRQIPYDWVISLSGQDYPLRSISELENELSASPYDGYFCHFRALDTPNTKLGPINWSIEEVMNRYFFRYGYIEPEVTVVQRAILKLPRLLTERTSRYRLHTSYAIAWGTRRISHPFTSSFELYGGSYWTTLRCRAARAVLQFVDDRPDIVNYFRECILPDEAFLATVLGNDRTLKISSRELRYYDYRGGRHGRPRTFITGDEGELFTSGCYIGRKFDMRQDSDILDILDKRIFESN